MAALLVSFLLSQVFFVQPVQGSNALVFLDEKLPIPDSQLFSEPDYIDSGVGLVFGVDFRIAYLNGNYTEAISRFANLVQDYPYKSEIWLYLARAHFYQKQPEQARHVLKQAADTLPDLAASFWQPLLRGLNMEVRKRANQLQIQVDFYSQNQSDFLALFRLYRFLDDQLSAAKVIGSAERQTAQMDTLATAVVGNSRRLYRQQASKWSTLAQQLRSEFSQVWDAKTLGPPPPVDKDPGDLDELRRLLQLRVDFYQSTPSQMSQLFDSYMAGDQRQRAVGLQQALKREIGRVRLKASTEAARQEEAQLLQKANQLEELYQDWGRQLGVEEVAQ